MENGHQAKLHSNFIQSFYVMERSKLYVFHNFWNHFDTKSPGQNIEQYRYFLITRLLFLHLGLQKYLFGLKIVF